MTTIQHHMKNSTLHRLVLLGLALCLTCRHAEADGNAFDHLKLSQLWQWSSGNHAPLHIVHDARGSSLLFVAMRRGGVQFLDESSGTGVAPLSCVPIRALGGLEATALCQKGDLLYVALGNIFLARGDKCGLATIDISNAKNPKVLSLWLSDAISHGASSLLINGDYLYLGAMSKGIFIFNIADAKKPVFISNFQPDIHFPARNPGRIQHPNVRGFATQGNLLYTCYDAGGLRIIDITDKGNPKEIGRYVNSGMGKRQQAYNGIALNFPLAYLAVDYAGVEIVDLSTPSNPRQLCWYDPWKVASGRNNWFNSGGHTNQIAIDKATKRLFVSAGDSEVLVLDVSNPALPLLLHEPGARKDRLGAWGICLDRDVVYVGYIKSLIPFHSNWNGIKAFSWTFTRP